MQNPHGEKPGSTVNLLMESGIFRDPMPTSGSAKAISAWKELSITEGPKKKPNWVPGANLGQSMDRYGKWVSLSFTVGFIILGRTITLHLQSGKSRRLGTFLLHLNLRDLCMRERTMQMLARRHMRTHDDNASTTLAPGEHNGSVVAKAIRSSHQKSTSNRCRP